MPDRDGRYGEATDGPFYRHREALDTLLAEMELLHWSLERLAAALDGQAMAAVWRAARAELAQQADGDPADDGRFDDLRIEDETPSGAFGYVPIALPRFLAELRALDAALAADPDYALAGPVAAGPRYRPVRFLELGCGYGRNLALLRDGNALEWLSLSGIDISPRMIALGRQALGLHDELAVGDAMGIDVSGYDVLYTYRPFRDDRLEAKFEKHLIAGMKVSAYLLAPLQMVVGDSRRMAKVGGSGTLFKKIA